MLHDSMIKGMDDEGSERETELKDSTQMIFERTQHGTVTENAE